MNNEMFLKLLETLIVMASNNEEKTRRILLLEEHIQILAEKVENLENNLAWKIKFSDWK